MAQNAKWWYEYHKEDYAAVKERLCMCRNIMLHGRKDAAADILEKAAVNAVLSIQTSRERHERAFTMYYGADVSIERACGETVYHNHKADWLHETLGDVDFRAIVDTLRTEGHVAAHKEVVDKCKGLAWTKGAFALAMCGVWELACPDSRTKEMLGIEGRVRTHTAYKDALQQIEDSLDIEEPTFVKQWVLYDFKAQEHARHMPFFIEALPSLK